MAASRLKCPVDFTLVDPTRDDYARQLDVCLDYVANNINNPEKRKITMKVFGKTFKNLGKLPMSHFGFVGKYAYIIYNGGTLSQDHSTYIHTYVEDQISLHMESRHEDDANQTTKKIQTDNTLEKVMEVCQRIDSIVDEFISNQTTDLSKINTKKILLDGKLRYHHYVAIENMYDSDMNELSAVIKGGDEQLTEAYSHIKKDNVRKLLGFYAALKENVVTLKENSVPVKKAKPMDKEKMAKSLKFKAEDSKFRIKSISPTDIIGSRTLWVFNTVNRKLGVYHAVDQNGLSIRGSSIINYNGDSIEKTVRTSHNIDLGKFVRYVGSTKKTKFDEIQSVGTKLTGRIHDSCLLLSVE